MSRTEDYYEILGVDKAATAEDIKKAFVIKLIVCFVVFVPLILCSRRDVM